MRTVVTQAELANTVATGRAAVLFHAHWCPFCRAFVPRFVAATKAVPSVAAVEAVLDDEGNPLWEEYQIDVVPTVLLFENGDVVERLDGVAGVGLRERDLAQALTRLTPGSVPRRAP